MLCDVDDMPALFYVMGAVALLIAGVIGCLLIAFIWEQMRKARADRRAARRCCIACGYDLRASPSNCPECGYPISRTTVESHATSDRGR